MVTLHRTVTELLLHWRDGDRAALDELIPAVYTELRRIAGRQIRGEAKGHTLQATALVNEAYARLIDSDVSWQNRAHFFSVAARQMRHILVDYARSRRSAKRGGDRIRVTLSESLGQTCDLSDELLALHEAMQRLEEHDQRKSRAVELSYFGGLSQTEIAEVLEVSPATVKRDLRMATAWLRSEMSEDGSLGE